MATTTNRGAKVYVGPANNAAKTSGEYAALTWTLVGEVTDIPQFGDNANLVTSEPLAEGRVRKQKGTRNAGSMTLQYDLDPADTGQADLDAAAQADDFHAFRIELDDAGDGSPNSPTTFYFHAFVMGAPVTIGTANNFVRKQATLEIDSDVLQVDAV